MEFSDRLEELIDSIQSNSAIAAKREISLVSEVLGAASWVSGPGDDGAALQVGTETVIACGEALWPPFVRHDPRGAGIAAVLANVNDVAAMGGEPVAIVDTVVGDRQTARLVLEGMRYASELYKVPIVGGHLSIVETAPSVSAFAIGRASAVLSCTNAAPGQDLIVAACIDGTMRPDFPFFTSFEQRGDRLAADVRLLSEISRTGLARAAKDISMAGLVGSLAMLLEWGGLGVSLDVDAVPAPEGVELSKWFNCFPCFGFLITCEPATSDECCAVFNDVGLAAARVGTLDESGLIRLSLGSQERTVIDLNATTATGITRSSEV